MKIKVKQADGFRISLWMPIFFLKYKWVWRLMTKDNENLVENYPLILDAYKAVKSYKKDVGHFDLVDVETHDGDIVKIVI